jgi:hypothetical protein
MLVVTYAYSTAINLGDLSAYTVGKLMVALHNCSSASWVASCTGCTAALPIISMPPLPLPPLVLSPLPLPLLAAGLSLMLLCHVRPRTSCTIRPSPPRVSWQTACHGCTAPRSSCSNQPRGVAMDALPSSSQQTLLHLSAVIHQLLLHDIPPHDSVWCRCHHSWMTHLALLAPGGGCLAVAALMSLTLTCAPSGWPQRGLHCSLRSCPSGIQPADELLDG